jgi:FtsZ-binding cell division protein ZapB
MFDEEISRLQDKTVSLENEAFHKRAQIARLNTEIEQLEKTERQYNAMLLALHEAKRTFNEVK